MISRKQSVDNGAPLEYQIAIFGARRLKPLAPAVFQNRDHTIYERTRICCFGKYGVLLRTPTYPQFCPHRKCAFTSERQLTTKNDLSQPPVSSSFRTQLSTCKLSICATGVKKSRVLEHSSQLVRCQIVRKLFNKLFVRTQLSTYKLSNRVRGVKNSQALGPNS